MSKIKKYTFIIIDMQPLFSAANGKRNLINNIAEEIERAKSLNNHIMLVRFACFGRITSRLLQAIRNYPNSSVVIKHGRDGSRVILKNLPRKTHLKICGINTDQCVFYSVLGIARRFPKKFRIEVISKCCASDGGMLDHRNALSSMEEESNISIEWGLNK